MIIDVANERVIDTLLVTCAAAASPIYSRDRDQARAALVQAAPALVMKVKELITNKHVAVLHDPREQMQPNMTGRELVSWLHGYAAACRMARRIAEQYAPPGFGLQWVPNFKAAVLEEYRERDAEASKYDCAPEVQT